MPTRYNERSWAIDVITEINFYCQLYRRKIARAGGEHTLVGPERSERSLFPDVLLFNQPDGSSVLQGWELKFPDTPITDEEYIRNAREKAQRLQLKSFVLWNVSTAVLYISDGVNYQPVKTWKDLADIRRREQVVHHRKRWTKLLHSLLNDLNDFFEDGTLSPSPIIRSLREGAIHEIIIDNMALLASEIERRTVVDNDLDSKITIWWNNSKQEYRTSNLNVYEVLAQHNLLAWIGKFLFSHILKRFYGVRKYLDRINEQTTIREAQAIFQGIAKQFNFWQIFDKALGDEVITDQGWHDLIQLHSFLYDIHFEQLDQSTLHDLLQETVYVSSRKVAGQYTTPEDLAQLLIRLTIDDKSSRVLDPFSGTGTIPRAVYNLKLEYGLSHSESTENIWASDKFAFPLRMTTLALSHPVNIGETLKVFRSDIVDLSPGRLIYLQNPNTGELIEEIVPSFNYIVSNLPFVQFENIKSTNPRVFEINNFLSEKLGSGTILPGKSDLYAYLVFHLWRLLKPRGKAGLIVSNSWLGTEWGERFQEILKRFFRVKKVVISGRGKWFANAEIVTTIMVVEKRPDIIKQPPSEESITFLTIQKPLDKSNLKKISSLAFQRVSAEGEIEVVQYKNPEVEALKTVGIGLSALFSDLRWLIDMKDQLIPAKQVFRFFRGERRGWNAMFYPEGNHGIEPHYIRPVLKSPSKLVGLVVEPTAEAFCCSETIETLEKLGHQGALNWIRKFEHATNKVGTPLPKALHRSNLHWYEMRSDAVADFFALINYDERLYFGRTRVPAFIDQRLIGMSLKRRDMGSRLCHALLNSSLGLFYLEALGFGRGLGALDLNQKKVASRLFMFNPALVSAEQEAEIVDAFAPLLSRDILPLEQELASSDRKEFDRVVFRIFGVEHKIEQVYTALRYLHCIRRAPLRV